MLASTKDPLQYTALHYDSEFNGLPVDQGQGPLIARHLGLLEDLLQRARNAHDNSLAVRFDLHCPNTIAISATLNQGNGLVSLFWSNLYEQLFNAQPAAPFDLHFAWTREHDPHTGQATYKALILLNARAFHGLYSNEQAQDIGTSDSLAGCILRAWAKSLRISDPPPPELVSFPTDPLSGKTQVMLLNRYDHNAWRELFTQSSSLCKYEGKPLGRVFCAFRTSNRQ